MKIQPGHDDFIGREEYLTTEQLGEVMIATVQQMSPEQKLKLRRAISYSVLTQTEKRRIN